MGGRHPQNPRPDALSWVTPNTAAFDSGSEEVWVGAERPPPPVKPTDRYASAAGLPPGKHTCSGMKPSIATHLLDADRMLGCVKDSPADANIQ